MSEAIDSFIFFYHIIYVYYTTTWAGAPTSGGQVGRPVALAYGPALTLGARVRKQGSTSHRPGFVLFMTILHRQAHRFNNFFSSTHSLYKVKVYVNLFGSNKKWG